MSEIKIIYVTFQLLLFVIFLVYGKKLSYTDDNKEYWLKALVPIIAYSIISGLRFGRDVDWNYNAMEYIYNDFSGESEPGYLLLVNFLHSLNFPFFIFPFLCSTFLIVSYCRLLQNFKEYCVAGLALFLIISGCENLIRWYLAMSIFMWGASCWLSEKKKISIILIILSTQFHFAIILPELFIIICYLTLNKKMFNPYIAFSLYVISIFFANLQLLQNITQHIGVLNFLFSSESASFYLERANEIASGEKYIHAATLISSISNIVIYGFVLIWGGKNYIFKPNEYWIFNLMCIYLCFCHLFQSIEIFDRIASAIQLFAVIPVGAVFSYLYYYKHEFSTNTILVGLVSFLLITYSLYKVPFDKDDETTQMLYIWNAEGREYIPVENFIR